MKNRLKSITFKQIYITGISVLFLGFIIGLNNFNTDAYEENLIQRINEINTSVANLPEFLPATRQQISNAEAFSSSVFQASQTIGENDLGSIPIIIRFLPFSGHYEAQKRISNAKGVLAGPRQTLLRASQDSNYLVKFIFYAPAEEFASYGQNELLDDERIQRTKQGFQAIRDNTSLSESYKEDIAAAIRALEKLEDTKDLEVYIESISQIQLRIADTLNAVVTQEKTTVNQLYNQYLYQ